MKSLLNVPNGLVYALTPKEKERARKRARAIYDQNRAAGIKDRKFSPADGRVVVFSGCGAEEAFEATTGIPIDRTVSLRSSILGTDPGDANDGERIYQIKCRLARDEKHAKQMDLLVPVRQQDAKADIFVLYAMLGSWERSQFMLLGALTGEEFEKFVTVVDLGYGPTLLVPKERLRSLRAVLDELGVSWEKAVG